MVGGLRTDLTIVSTTTLDGEGLYHQKESSVALMRAVLRQIRDTGVRVPVVS